VNPFNPLTALVPKTVLACSGCKASHRKNHQKSCRCFEKACNLPQNGTQHFSIRSSQSPGIAFQS